MPLRGIDSTFIHLSYQPDERSQTKNSETVGNPNHVDRSKFLKLTTTQSDCKTRFRFFSIFLEAGS